jgi:hypothetical protein
LDVRKPEKWLIVVTDADKGTVKSRLNELQSRISESKDDRVRKCRVEGENIARLIPKWSVETWILNLNGEAVDEDTPYKSRNRSWSDLIRPAAVQLHSWVNSKADPPEPSCVSLKHGIGELRRLSC